MITLDALLTADRTRVVHEELDREQVLACLGGLLAGAEASAADIVDALRSRERLQSTGLGEGVAIPHAALASLSAQRAALLICPAGVDFDAIDGQPVKLFVAVVGPRTTSGEHLRILARLSRLLRSRHLREQLSAAESGEQASELLLREDRA